MKKRKSYGVSIDSHQADAVHYPKMPSSSLVAAAGHEMKKNPPSVVEHTARKYGRARAKKQRTAILLSKARRGG